MSILALRRRALVLLLCVAGSAFAGAIEAGPPAGLHALTPANQSIPARILHDPRVSAVVVRSHWPDLEPREGDYDWAYLDEQIARAGAAQMPVSLAVTAGGVATPQWLQSKVQSQLSFTNANAYHASAGQVLTIPLFWDPKLLAAKHRLIRALGARYGEEPGLALVSVQCANATTDDWNLPVAALDPASLERVRGGEAKLAEACRSLLDTTMQAFPGQWVRMAVGRVPPPMAQRPDAVVEALLAYAQRRYGDRFVIQRHNLSARTPRPGAGARLEGWAVLAAAQGHVGGQMLWPAKDVRSCRMNGGHSPCDSATMLRRALTTARAYRMRYVEVYAADLLDPAVASVLAQAAAHWSRPVAAEGNPGVRSSPDRRVQRDPVRRPAARQAARPPPVGQADDWRWVNPPSGRRPLPPGVGHGRFRSELLGAEVGYGIYLPPGYEQSEASYPVLYWLHGKQGHESRGLHIAEYLTAAMERGLIPPTIMVFVNAGGHSFYSDAKSGRLPVESMLIEELLPHIETRYRVHGQRRQRCLHGFSMGGFGALKFAAKYPELFGAVVVYGGALLDAEHPPGRRDAAAFETMFGSDLDYFERQTPAYWLHKRRDEIRDSELRIRMVVGLEDGTRRYNRHLHARLEQWGIAHEYVELPGVGHAPRAYYEADQGRGFAFCGLSS